jgi:hypothetical protein
MANHDSDPNLIKDTSPGPAYLAGIILIFSGALILVDLSLKTGWITLIIMPAIGFTFLIGGLRTQKLGLIIPGGIISGLGIGGLLFFSKMISLSWMPRIGLLLAAFGLGWLSIALLSFLLFRKITWWAIITGSIIFSTGLAFLFSPIRITVFVLFISIGLGFSLLSWGITSRLFGLIIPGCLLLGIGPGIYAAWGRSGEPNSLARTGIMLVGFALGWGLITLFSRVITAKFLWWPLIPGGILAMVGWGLYIGGNPRNAISFIGNTGSIGLIIFGIYLLLLRKGIHS